MSEIFALKRRVFLDVGHISLGVSGVIVLSVVLVVLVDRLLSLDFPLNSDSECIGIVIGDVITLVQVYAVDGVLDVTQVFNLALVVQNGPIRVNDAWLLFLEFVYF